MKVDILCDSCNHPIIPFLNHWKNNQCDSLDIEILNHMNQLSNGDILFLVSCQSILSPEHTSGYGNCLVLHASDLPEGRGWSPHIWQILEGRKEITVTLLEAHDRVDQGDIWHKICMPLTGLELYNEINNKLFQAELQLMDWAIENYESITPKQQVGSVSYYPKRTPKDSELKLDKTLAEQFDLLRVCDPDRYPAYVMVDGVKFILTLSKEES